MRTISVLESAELQEVLTPEARKSLRLFALNNRAVPNPTTEEALTRSLRARMFKSMHRSSMKFDSDAIHSAIDHAPVAVKRWGIMPSERAAATERIAASRVERGELLEAIKLHGVGLKPKAPAESLATKIYNAGVDAKALAKHHAQEIAEIPADTKAGIGGTGIIARAKRMFKKAKTVGAGIYDSAGKYLFKHPLMNDIAQNLPGMLS